MHKTMDFTLEVKQVNEEGIFSGYASTWGGLPDCKGDVIRPGAFAKTLAEGGRNKSGIVMLWAHQPDEPIGVWTELIEDKKGLKVTGKLILTTPAGRKAYELLKNKALKHMSIGYDAVKFSYSKDKKIRYLEEIDLWEISLVSFPCLRTASVLDVKSDCSLIASIQKVANDIGQLELQAAEDLQELTTKVSQKMESSAVNKNLEHFFKAAEKVNLSLSRTEEKLSESLQVQVPSFDKALSDVDERLNHVEGRLREKYIAPQQQESEPSPRLTSYERTGDFSEPYEEPDFSYLNCKVTRGVPGRRLVSIPFPGGAAN